MKERVNKTSYISSLNGYFMNEAVKPSYEDLLNIIGAKEAEWNKFYDFLKNGHRLKANFKFYGSTIGWIIEFRQSGKLKIIMAPDKDDFKIGIYTNEENNPDLKYIENFENPYLQIHNHINPSSLRINTLS